MLTARTYCLPCTWASARSWASARFCLLRHGLRRIAFVPPSARCECDNFCCRAAAILRGCCILKLSSHALMDHLVLHAVGPAAHVLSGTFLGECKANLLRINSRRCQPKINPEPYTQFRPAIRTADNTFHCTRKSPRWTCLSSISRKCTARTH